MALRKIYKEGESILKKTAKPVTKFNGRLAQLLDDMTETLKDANGVGLAAQQVGILKRAVLIDAGDQTGVVELINPVVVECEGEQTYYEGCLSYPGYYGNVGRPESVVIDAFDRHGNPVSYRATKLFAVACCHELDHLEGRMFMPQVRGKLYTLEEVKQLRAESGDTDDAGADEVGDAEGAAGADGAASADAVGKPSGQANKDGEMILIK